MQATTELPVQGRQTLWTLKLDHSTDTKLDLTNGPVGS
jgi:hypothetical protein